MMTRLRSLLVAPLLVVPLLVAPLLGACASDDDRSDRHQPAVKPGCQRTVCLAGAITRADGANPAFGELCARLPGLVEDCGGDGCYPMFDMFGSDAALEALVAALDDSGDGAVDGDDAACDVALVGYSWGGVNAVKLAARLVGDGRLAPDRRRVATVVAIDPFALVPTLDVPAGVEAFWGYRHSTSPALDCSRQVLLGPYRGFAPRCHESVRCRDYDYSLAPTATFNGLAGADVGHCSIVRAAGPAVAHNVTTGADHASVPPTVPVETFGTPAP